MDKTFDNYSIKWFCTIGVNSGYDLEDQKKLRTGEFSKIYLELAEELFKETGTYISAVITPSRTLYSPVWGCPEEGEYSFTISGACNTEFAEVADYKATLEILMQRLKEHFKQSTLLLEIVPAELYYYK